jgi:tetratricopeptide (TPR) repeat protein
MVSRINEALLSTEDINELYTNVIKAADQFLSSGQHVNALAEYEYASSMKPGEEFPRQKAAEVKAMIDKAETDLLEFNEAIQRGEQYLAIEDLAKAKAEFEKASQLRPDAAYPKEKLKELKSKMDEIKEQQESYDQIIALADKLFQEGKYEQAKAEYEKALKIKPDETYPAARITEITRLIDKDANAGKEYLAVIAEADGLFKSDSLEKANLQYMKASYIKPEEKYPKNRMAEIDSIILTRKNIAAEFNKFVAAGDRWLEIKDYEKAREKYTEAQKIRPEDKYPRQKLVEIDSLVVQNEIAAQDIYNGLIEEGDKHFGKKEYEQAKTKFQNALKYKPGEDYPSKKIGEIDSLVTELEALQAKYSVLISEADQLFTSKKYQEAKTKYIAASALLPDEQFPKTRIEEINLHFKTSNQQNQQAYDKAIADADKYFASGILDQALDMYRNAKALNTEETYPDEMITRILTKLEENAIRNLISETLTLENNTEKKLTFEPVPVSDRKSNFLFVKAKNLSEKEFKIVLSYGKGGTKNGGFVLPVPNQADVRDFIIPIGKQYNWFSQDNDWINLYSQGGKVEISTGKISKGD